MEALLKKLQQIIFLEKIQKLPKEKQKKIFLQIKKFDQQLLWQQKQDFLKRSSVSTTYTPWTKVAFPKKEDATVGRFLLQKAKIAFVLLAAGQASRLDFHKPKGCFPISPVKKKSLFQVFAEKILAAQQKYQQKFCIACMLSPMNEEATIAFLQKHQFFGLEKKQWIFFTQNVVPLLDEEGNWFLTSDDLIAIGPDGNGSMLLHLFTSKVQEIFTKNNIEVLSIFSIDNPLVNPCEEAMIGYHYRQKNDVTVRCIAKEKNMGLLAKDNNTLKIVEYIYSNKNAKTFLWANTNHFCVSLSFVKKMFSQSFLLPYHFSKKKLQGKNIFTCEKFFFDNFNKTHQIGAMAFAKEDCFAPLKEKKDIAKVQKQWIEKDKKVLQAILGERVILPEKIEIGQDLHFTKKNFCQKKYIIQNSYIEEVDLV